MSRFKPSLDPDRWIAHFPELATRPLLIERMKIDGKLRHRMFEVMMALESIALIPYSRIAGHCLMLYWIDTRRLIYKYYHDKLRLQTGSDVLFNEMYGCLRNVAANMFTKAGLKSTPLFRKTKFDVVRIYKRN